MIKSLRICLVVCIALFVLSGCDLFQNLTGGDTDDDDVTAVDSDGDGYSDEAELDTYRFDPDNNPLKFNPYIADLPKIDIRLTSLPEISIESEHTSGVVETVETEWSTTDESSLSTSSTSGTATTVTHEAGATIGVEHEFGLLGGTTASLELSYSYSNSQETSSSFTRDVAHTRSTAYTEAKSRQESEEYTLTGGTLKVTLDIVNSGDISYTIESLALSAVLLQPLGSTQVVPIANLGYDGGDFPETTLAPREKMNNATFSAEIDVSTALGLLQSMNNVSIQVSSYQIVDENGRAFAHNMTVVEARTCSLLVDYGVDSPLPPERYKISLDFADSASVSLSTLFRNMLHASYAESAVTVNGKSVTGLASVRTKSADTATGGWLVIHTYSNAGIRESRIYSPMESYSLSGIQVKRGDTVLVLYVEDKDHDGLLARHEFAYGTSDENTDTDGDGTSDFDEIMAGTDPLRTPEETGPAEPGDTPQVTGVSAFIPDNNRTTAHLDWTIPEGAVSVVILRYKDPALTGSSISANLVDGRVYSTGGGYSTVPSTDTTRTYDVVYAGSAAQHEDTDLEFNTDYHYAIYAASAARKYSAPVHAKLETDIKVKVSVSSLSVRDVSDGTGDNAEYYWSLYLYKRDEDDRKILDTPYLPIVYYPNEEILTIHRLDEDNHWSTGSASTAPPDKFSPVPHVLTYRRNEASKFFVLYFDVNESDDGDDDEMLMYESIRYDVSGFSSWPTGPQSVSDGEDNGNNYITIQYTVEKLSQ